MKMMAVFLYLLFITAWVCGVALAKGFWMTLLCAMLFPVAWVVFAQHLLGVPS